MVSRTKPEILKNKIKCAEENTLLLGQTEVIQKVFGA